jgi:hypothetical protein
MAVSQQIIKTTLKQGAVYLMRHRTLTSPKKHFVVVMNEHPCGEVIILFNVVTSKIDTVKKLLQKSGAPHYTAVELSPKTESFLSVDSIVNCNDCKASSLDDFKTDLASPEAQFVGNISPKALADMITATLASRQVSPAYKKIISQQKFAAIERTRLLPEAERSKISIVVS